jgi:hypothetical protein
MPIGGFYGVPDLEAPSDGMAVVWDKALARPRWRSLTGAMVGGFTPGQVPYASAAGVLTSDAGLSYSLRTLTVGDGTSNGLAKITGAAGGSRDLGFYSAATARWFLRCNTTAESGSNAGSDFQIVPRDDAGSALTIALTITRSTGALTLANTTATHTISSSVASTSASTGALVVGGGLGVAGAIFAGGTITATKDSDYSGNVGGLTTKGATSPNATVRIGVTTTPVYFIQANLDGTGSRPLSLQPGGGNLLIGTVTDDGTNNLQVAGSAKVASTTASTSTTTGALIVAGGVGVAGRIYTANLTVDAGNTDNQITLGNGTNGDAQIIFRNGSTHRGWMFGTQFTTSETFEVIPSTAVGGTTFTTPVFSVDYLSNVVLGAKSILATNATDGFTYAPSCGGTPSGTPTGFTGKVPFVIDTSGSKVWAYIGGAWKSAALT